MEEVKNEVSAEESKEESKEQTAVSNIETNFELGLFGSSNNFKMAWQMASALAQSTVVPQAFQKNASNCLIAIEQSQRLNMSPFMVMQNLHIIKGKPSWSSKFLIAMINGSNKYDMELQFTEEKDTNGKPFSCMAWTTKNGRRVEGMTVDMDMAKAEGWLTKDGSKWKTMPQVMLRYRAASFFANMNCPELTLGFYTKEEHEDNYIYDTTMSEEERVEQEIIYNANSVDFE